MKSTETFQWIREAYPTARKNSIDHAEAVNKLAAQPEFAVLDKKTKEKCLKWWDENWGYEYLNKQRKAVGAQETPDPAVSPELPPATITSLPEDPVADVGGSNEDARTYVDMIVDNLNTIKEAQKKTLESLTVIRNEIDSVKGIVNGV